MKQMFFLISFLIILIYVSSAAAEEHKPFPLQQEKTTASAQPSKETHGFFAWLLVLLALSIGIGLVIYAVLTHERKPKNPNPSKHF